jgi:hypothetical protein
MLAVEVVEQGALGSARQLDDVVQAAALKAVRVELGERGIQDAAAGDFGRLRTLRQGHHRNDTDQSV